MKRIFDFCLASLFLLAGIIPMLVVAMVVKLTSKGPVFYWSERIGRFNRLFQMPKFRTMRTDSPQVATHLLNNSQQWLTPVGSFLRSTSLDELPQLWSILKGDIAFIGPRPALHNQDDLIALRTYYGVHVLRPGLTGWAQVNGRDELSVPDKVTLDTYYLQNQSIWLDIRIFVQTFFRVLHRSGIGVPGELRGIEQGSDIPKDAYMASTINWNALQCYDRALADADRVIEVDRDNAVAYNNRGVVKAALNENDRALGDFDTAICLSPDFQTALRNRAYVQETIGLENNKMENRIRLSPPHMSPREREFLLDAFDSNWIAPLGPHVDEFEREFAAKVGATEAVALSSGTAALHLSMLLLGVGPGDEVFTSSLTFVATANAITYVGAKPVFIDSDRESWNIDPDLLGKELEASVKRGKLPKAVVAVDLYGQCADYDRIVKLCQFYDVPLVEDAAEALGATYNGKSAGKFGAMGIFSFNGNKIITASGGGMLVTDNKDWAEKARYLATQARDPAPHYQHSEIGYNYRMSNLLAAVGRGQLSVLDTRVNQRRANFDYYRQALADLPGISFMPEISGGRSTRWLTCITVDPEKFGATAEEIRLEHERCNIESRPLWKPMHMQPVFANCRIRGGEVSEHLFDQGLCLPSGSNLTDSDRERVVEAIRSVCTQRPTEVRVGGDLSKQPANR